MIKDTNFWQQVLWMHVGLPLTKEHLSNDTFFYRKVVSLLEGDLLYIVKD